MYQLFESDDDIILPIAVSLIPSYVNTETGKIDNILLLSGDKKAKIFAEKTITSGNYPFRKEKWRQANKGEAHKNDDQVVSENSKTPLAKLAVCIGPPSGLYAITKDYDDPQIMISVLSYYSMMG